SARRSWLQRPRMAKVWSELSMRRSSDLSAGPRPESIPTAARRFATATLSWGPRRRSFGWRVLGAGSLTNTATGELGIDLIRKIPDSEAWIEIPAQQLKQLEYLRTVDT